MSGAFVLAHLSDPHLPPPAAALASWPLKRVLARASWRRRRFRMLRAVSEAVAADVAAARPDHVAMTGDLTSFGLDAEFEAGAAWLARLGPPDRVTFTPGNHDALVDGDWTRGEVHLRPWTTGDDRRPGFPLLRRRGELALIALSSAIATPPGIAAGALGDAQIAAADRLLAATRGLFRVVLLHHPPGEGEAERKALRDRRALRGALARAGAELVLHGHTHHPELVPLESRDGPLVALGVPSAAMRAGGPEAAAWRALRIERTPEGWRIEARERAVDASGALSDRARLVFRLPRELPRPAPRPKPAATREEEPE